MTWYTSWKIWRTLTFLSFWFFCCSSSLIIHNFLTCTDWQIFYKFSSIRSNNSVQLHPNQRRHLQLHPLQYFCFSLFSEATDSVYYLCWKSYYNERYIQFQLSIAWVYALFFRTSIISFLSLVDWCETVRRSY